MSDQVPTSQPGLKIDVTIDQMKATLTVDGGAKVSSADVIAAIRAMKITRFDDGLIIETVEKQKDEPLVMEVATGTSPIEDGPERIDYRVPVADGVKCQSCKVSPGQVIATFIPAVVGTDGTDVYGLPVLRRKAVKPMIIGRNLLASGGKIICQAAGNLRLHNNTLSVEPLLELRGNDDTDKKPVVFDGDAIVKGSLDEGRSIQITGSLSVGGAIEAIQLKTGGSVFATGGIVGKQKGRYMIGGDLRCRYVSGGFIVAGQDVQIQSDITDSRIVCGGRLAVAQGVIFGGALAANGGLWCHSLGHLNGAPTLIEAGDGISSRSFLASASQQIEANQKRIRVIRSTIDPLLKMMKLLNPQQREKATELLYDVEELEASTRRLAADLENQTRALAEGALAKIVVASVVHAGVIIRFHNVKTTFTASIRGPLTLVPHKVGNLTQVMLIDEGDQTKTLLPSQMVDAGVETKHGQMMAA